MIPLVVTEAESSARFCRTPEAAGVREARSWKSLGRFGFNEKIATAVFVVVCGLWATSSATKIDITVIALGGATYC